MCIIVQFLRKYTMCILRKQTERSLVMQTEYNMTEAANIAGVSRRTFYNHIESKPITTKRNDSDEKVVDLSELKRVYGDEKVLKNLQKMQSNDAVQDSADAHNEGVHPVQNSQTIDAQLLKARVEALEKEKELIENQGEQMRDERDYLRERLEDAQKAQNKMTLLLEDKSKKTDDGGDWNKSIKALENRIANQEQAEKERREREAKLEEENAKLKRAYKAQKQKLADEQNKGFFQKLFGT